MIASVIHYFNVTNDFCKKLKKVITDYFDFEDDEK